MSLIFDDDHPEETPMSPKPKPIKPAQETPKPSAAPKPQPKDEDRSALRFNVLLRRFIINGYRMESMLGKFRVWRGDKCLTKWNLSFVDAITEIEPELLQNTNYPDIGKTLYQEIGELKALLQEVVDENISEGVQTDLRERIEGVLNEDHHQQTQTTGPA